MAAADPPDPLVVALGEIRDVLAEIRDRMPPPIRVAPTAMAQPTRSAPPERPATRATPSIG